MDPPPAGRPATQASLAGRLTLVPWSGSARPCRRRNFDTLVERALAGRPPSIAIKRVEFIVRHPSPNSFGRPLTDIVDVDQTERLEQNS